MPPSETTELQKRIRNHESGLRLLLSRCPLQIQTSRWDNRDSWDNKSSGGGFDNRPAWDNWNKRQSSTVRPASAAI